MSFIGRSKELQKLSVLKQKKTSSLVCVLGRRRIGKSALIEEWSKEFNHFFEVQGLGPDLKSTKAIQLEHFSEEIALRFKIAKPQLNDWDQAFDFLSQLTKKGEWLILLDEISWMATGDSDFAVKLKSAWDIKFKKNPKLILVLCGSVSTWIEENILNSSHFLGRVSLTINLQELNLQEISHYMDRHKFYAGSFEKMSVLSISGGVPKYLEEVTKNPSTVAAITEMAFDPSGILYNDFDNIFKDIFKRRSTTFEKIIRHCLTQKKTPQSLANSLKVDYSSDLSEAINILELSGFLSRDYFFNPKTDQAEKLSFLRVKDNYTRFYLKIIEPLKKNIEKGGRKIESLSNLKTFESILGYQFENLILANKKIIHELLNLQNQEILSSAPYFQRKTTLTPIPCQIDLLIHTNLDVFYLCEFKCKKIIQKNIVAEVRKKMDSIKIPKRSSLKPILIYEGVIYPPDEDFIKRYFFKIISFSEMLKTN